MIPQEQQVCNLELSLKLKELGVEQESYWCWNYHDATSEDDMVYGFYGEWELEQGKSGDKSCSAYTVAELDERLPKYVLAKFEKPNSELWYSIRANGISNELCGASILIVMTKLLIWLIENKRVKL